MRRPRVYFPLDSDQYVDFRNRAESVGITPAELAARVVTEWLDGMSTTHETVQEIAQLTRDMHGWLGGKNGDRDSRGLRQEIEDLGDLLWRVQLRLEQLGSPQLRQLFVRIYTYVDRLVYHQLGESQYRRVRDDVLRGATKILSELDAATSPSGQEPQPMR